MKSLSTVGFGLSIVFGILLLALIAEVYYLLWWKNRITTSRGLGTDISNPAADFLYVFCWKKQSSMTQTAAVGDTQDQQQNINRDLLLKPFGNETSGPPKFLFPIIEETKEEMESEDSKSRSEKSRGRSLSELLITAETPYLTPVASPSMLTHPLTSSPNNHVSSESAREAEFNRRKSSPPPKFKFLQAAEEKLRRKLMEQDEEENRTTGSKHFKDEEEDEPYVAIVVDENQETRSKSNHHHQKFQFS